MPSRAQQTAFQGLSCSQTLEALNLDVLFFSAQDSVYVFNMTTRVHMALTLAAKQRLVNSLTLSVSLMFPGWKLEICQWPSFGHHDYHLSLWLCHYASMVLSLIASSQFQKFPAWAAHLKWSVVPKGQVSIYCATQPELLLKEEENQYEANDLLWCQLQKIETNKALKGNQGYQPGYYQAGWREKGISVCCQWGLQVQPVKGLCIVL